MTVKDNSGPYGIGADNWPGLAKLIEECGEVLQVLGKLLVAPDLDHKWICKDCKGKAVVVRQGLILTCITCKGAGFRGAGDLTDILHEELGDLHAALDFFVFINDEIDFYRVQGRTNEKYATFTRWHDEGHLDATG